MNERLCPGVQQQPSADLHWPEADLHHLHEPLFTCVTPPPPLWSQVSGGVSSGKVIEERVTQADFSLGISLKLDGSITYTCVWVCVCVCERERNNNHDRSITDLLKYC